MNDRNRKLQIVTAIKLLAKQYTLMIDGPVIWSDDGDWLLYRASERGGAIWATGRIRGTVMECTDEDMISAIHASLDAVALALRGSSGPTVADSPPGQVQRYLFRETGTFRVHFNRHGAAPLVWCVSTDAFGLAVASIEIRVPVRSVYSPKATPDSDDGKPSDWLEATGTLTFVDGVATIEAT